MKNMDFFEGYRSYIMAQLYIFFPVKKVVSITNGVDGACAPENTSDIAMATVEWLGDSGYLRFNEQVGSDFIDVVLTAKGLAMLRSMPNAPFSSECFGDRLVHLWEKDDLKLATKTGNAAFAMAASITPC